MAFLLDPNDPQDRYFSYMSMVIPSNDAFIANGNPTAHPIFDMSGSLVANDFFVAGAGAVLDAGTEMNDESPMNTAFFGQMAPNTGVTENGVITDHLGFMPRSAGAILASSQFRNGDFELDGYPNLRFGFRTAPAITDTRIYQAIALGLFEVPPAPSGAIALTGSVLLDEGTRMVVIVQALGLDGLEAAHLHLAPAGENGPVVVDLLANVMPTILPNRQFFLAEVTSADLTGPPRGLSARRTRAPARSRRDLREPPHRGVPERRTARPAHALVMSGKGHTMKSRHRTAWIGGAALALAAATAFGLADSTARPPTEATERDRE